jgi:hypothetical protein
MTMKNQIVDKDLWKRWQNGGNAFFKQRHLWSLVTRSFWTRHLFFFFSKTDPFPAWRGAELTIVSSAVFTRLTLAVIFRSQGQTRAWLTMTTRRRILIRLASSIRNYTIHHKLSTIHHTSSTSHHTSSTIHHMLSTIHHTSSTIHHTSSAIHHTSSAIHYMLSPTTIRYQPPIIPHQPSSIWYQPFTYTIHPCFAIRGGSLG